MPRSAVALFETVRVLSEATRRHYEVSLSVLELYNEQVRVCVRASSWTASLSRPRVISDGRCVVVPGLRWLPCQVYDLLGKDAPSSAPLPVRQDHRSGAFYADGECCVCLRGCAVLTCAFPHW